MSCDGEYGSGINQSNFREHCVEREWEEVNVLPEVREVDG